MPLAFKWGYELSSVCVRASHHMYMSIIINYYDYYLQPPYQTRTHSHYDMDLNAATRMFFTRSFLLNLYPVPFCKISMDQSLLVFSNYFLLKRMHLLISQINFKIACQKDNKNMIKLKFN